MWKESHKMKLYVYEFIYKGMYIQKESSGKIRTTLITVITSGEENKIEVKRKV